MRVWHKDISKYLILSFLFAFLYPGQASRRSRVSWSLLVSWRWSLKYHIISVFLRLSFKVSYYLNLSLSIYPGQSGARLEPRAMWSSSCLPLVSRCSLKYRIIWILPHPRGGGWRSYRQNHFFLIWISIINSTPSTIFDLLLLLPKGLVFLQLGFYWLILLLPPSPWKGTGLFFS